MPVAVPPPSGRCHWLLPHEGGGAALPAVGASSLTISLAGIQSGIHGLQGAPGTRTSEHSTSRQLLEQVPWLLGARVGAFAHMSEPGIGKHQMRRNNPGTCL